jgi:hypothetical protein
MSASIADGGGANHFQRDSLLDQGIGTLVLEAQDSAQQVVSINPEFPIPVGFHAGVS